MSYEILRAWEIVCHIVYQTLNDRGQLTEEITTDMEEICKKINIVCDEKFKGGGVSYPHAHAIIQCIDIMRENIEKSDNAQHAAEIIADLHTTISKLISQ